MLRIMLESTTTSIEFDILLRRSIVFRCSVLLLYICVFVLHTLCATAVSGNFVYTGCSNVR